jgi:hypothetical protein
VLELFFHDGLPMPLPSAATFELTVATASKTPDRFTER